MSLEIRDAKNNGWKALANLGIICLKERSFEEMEKCQKKKILK